MENIKSINYKAQKYPKSMAQVILQEHRKNFPKSKKHTDVIQCQRDLGSEGVQTTAGKRDRRARQTELMQEVLLRERGGREKREKERRKRGKNLLVTSEKQQNRKSGNRQSLSLKGPVAPANRLVLQQPNDPGLVKVQPECVLTGDRPQ